MDTPGADLDELMALAVDLARRAAAVHRAGLERQQTYDHKTSATDLVSDVDREAERVIVEALRAARPEDAVLAEEATEEGGTSGIRWVVDPLDGTVNYSRRYPLFAVSIGIEILGVPEVGVVLDTARDRLFVGRRGGDATRDGAPIRAPGGVDLSQAVVATGFSYRPERRARQAGALEGLLPRIANIRCDGSAALDLCAVASGEVDAYFESEVAPWDVAAGRVVAEAAGVEVVVETVGLTTGVVAAAPDLLGPLMALLRQTGAWADTP
ncbi:MAG TPA: inositol monophosphatase family protein [Actinomycetota bacterium]|nr:inositol monophosphatase family protein [Actinomycetota bacterium]